MAIIESTRDIGLLNRAIREQWPTSPEMKAKAIAELEELIQNDDEATRLAAIDQLRKIDAHNFAMAKAAIPSLHLHQHNHESHSEGLTPDERRAANARRLDTLKRLGRN